MILGSWITLQRSRGHFLPQNALSHSVSLYSEGRTPFLTTGHCYVVSSSCRVVISREYHECPCFVKFCMFCNASLTVHFPHCRQWKTCAIIIFLFLQDVFSDSSQSLKFGKILFKFFCFWLRGQMRGTDSICFFHAKPWADYNLGNTLGTGDVKPLDLRFIAALFLRPLYIMSPPWRLLVRLLNWLH